MGVHILKVEYSESWFDREEWGSLLVSVSEGTDPPLGALHI